MKLFVLLLGIIAGLLSGCTSNLCGPEQLIYISTPPMEGASCYIQNDKGSWYVPCTPNMVRVCRSCNDLLIATKKPGFQDSYIRVKPRPHIGRLIWGRFVNYHEVSDYPDAVRIHLTPVCH